jgi:hypothetical protein
MDTRLKSSVTFLNLILFVSLFVSLLPNVSEARSLLNPLQDKEGVIGVFRTLKEDSGPSPGVGHILKKLQIIGGMKDSGPSPGEGHKYITNNNHS